MERREIIHKFSSEDEPTKEPPPLRTLSILALELKILPVFYTFDIGSSLAEILK
jgi:hypothetical protein